MSAYAARDGAAACELLTADARQALEGRDRGGSCRRAVERGPRLSGTYSDAARKLGAEEVTLVEGGRALVNTGTKVAAPGLPGAGGRGAGPGPAASRGATAHPVSPDSRASPGVGRARRRHRRTGCAGRSGSQRRRRRGGGGGSGQSGGGGGRGGGANGAPGADGKPGSVRGLAVLRKVGGDWKVASTPFLRFTTLR
ncbi:MAG: hypothetical protein WKF40_04765 [Thermoleophilaceae bacterium]